ncbi:MAG: radical SAM protein [Eubacteriaceae bacterium]
MEIGSRYACRPANEPDTEIVLLQGRGCFWKKCSFCNYYLDSDCDERTTILNTAVLSQVTGETGRLTVINSGSWFELPEETRAEILECCRKNGICELSTETHWAYAERTRLLKAQLAAQGLRLSPRIGIETFDRDFREDIMIKGIGKDVMPEDIAAIYEECCLLYGMQGQTEAQLRTDIATALSLFRRVYLNLYEGGEGRYPEDKVLTLDFRKRLLPEFQDKTRYPGLVVLADNTDLDVG